jgi:hypothetical protein
MSRINGLIGGTRIPTGTTASCSGIHTLSQHQEWVSRNIWEFFGPKRVSGLQAWFDASDASTLYDATSGGSLVASNGAVARWEDKSGNARHATQSTAGSRPVRKTNQLNSLDGLDFDGTNDTLNVNAMATFFSGVNPSHTVIAVAKTDITNSAQDLFSAANSSNDNENSRSIWNSASQKLAIARESTDPSSKLAVGSTSLGTSAKCATWLFNGTNGRVFLNGVADVSATDLTHPQSLPFNQAAIGSLPRASPAVFFNGLIFEVVIYNSALSDQSRSAVESYLITKWGIT